MEIAIALGIKRSTTEMAITRLVQMGLHERPRYVPREAKPKQPALSPTESFKLNRAQFSAAAAAGPALTLNSDPQVHPTGTPFRIVDGVMRASSGAVEALVICGQSVRSDLSHHQGTSNSPGAAHPWAWGASNRPKQGG